MVREQVNILFSPLVFQDPDSLYNSSGCPGIHSVDQAGLKLTEICLAVSQMLRLKAFTTTQHKSMF
ncbi:hypothetical protein I79_014494 [Cricetulus griseus]|uniref:Uncharacterized protein n=1 Tax=Cricetulus griseus TaxID=10029 RepID=G3HU86_CRIGR|nr:hypothetical protein I79_014494 [Cricetulus griseus]